MPTYDYQCGDCEHTFEEFQSITAKPLRKCPECGKPKLKRLIGTGAGVIFKGSGFWQTDYRSEAYKKSAEAEKPKDKTEKKADAKGEKKAETKKPAAGAEKSKSPAKKASK